jgi:hypothetical protein
VRGGRFNIINCRLFGNRSGDLRTDRSYLIGNPGLVSESDPGIFVLAGRMKKTTGHRAASPLAARCRSDFTPGGPANPLGASDAGFL